MSGHFIRGISVAPRSRQTRNRKIQNVNWNNDFLVGFVPLFLSSATFYCLENLQNFSVSYDTCIVLQLASANVWRRNANSDK